MIALLHLFYNLSTMTNTSPSLLLSDEDGKEVIDTPTPPPPPRLGEQGRRSLHLAALDDSGKGTLACCRYKRMATRSTEQSIAWRLAEHIHTDAPPMGQPQVKGMSPTPPNEARTQELGSTTDKAETRPDKAQPTHNDGLDNAYGGLLAGNCFATLATDGA